MLTFLFILSILYILAFTLLFAVACFIVLFTENQGKGQFGGIPLLLYVVAWAYFIYYFVA